MTERKYSHRTLAQKLGVENAKSALIARMPDDYSESLVVKIPAGKAPYDFIQLFATSAAQLSADFPALKKDLTPDGMLWVSWPKRGSGIEGDVDENIIRDIGLEAGLVDVKVISVNDRWSGLKFVYRTRDRV